MVLMNNEICCLTRALETHPAICKSLRVVTATLDDRLTAMEKPVGSREGAGGDEVDRQQQPGSGPPTATAPSPLTTGT